ncbi:MAG TPA: hypothetical protein VGP72_03490 [Planctomycetota bacterium]|jgi:hypothetical protein
MAETSVTEAVQTTAPRREFGLFRTPLAAGMLSGVLAGAVTYEASRALIAYALHGNFEFWLWVVALVEEYALLTGPALGRRSLSAAGGALMWTVALWLTEYAAWRLPRWLGVAFSDVNVQYLIWYTIMLALTGGLRGVALARLWQTRAATRHAAVLGVGSGLLAGGFWALGLYLASKAGMSMGVSPEGTTIHFFECVICGFIMTTLPALPIEKELQKQARENVGGGV